MSTCTEGQASEGEIELIKPEYVIRDHVRTLAIECVSEKDKRKFSETSDDGESRDKKQKLDEQRSKKLKGQNRGRGVTFREDRSMVLCPWLVDRRETEQNKGCSLEKCQYRHDLQEYLLTKPPDLADTCYVYSVRGHCPRGASCRFGRSHLTEEGFNIVDEERLGTWESDPQQGSLNTLPRDVQWRLKKKTYDFSKTETICKLITPQYKPGDDKKNGGKDEDKTPEAVAGKAESNGTEDKHLGPFDDLDLVKLRTEEKKKIDWRGKLYLSPLTTVGNLPFRRICKEFGADVTCGEMALAGPLLQGLPQEWALVRRHPSEDLFGAQVCGNNHMLMARCAQLLQENANLDFIDINLGCPLDMVCDQGSGSGLLRRTKMLGNIVKCMSTVLDIPLTVKTRIGICESKKNTDQLMPLFKEAGVSLITIHGRTKEQRYMRKADWEYIDMCAEKAKPTPLFGNGDILSFEDYETCLAKAPNVAGAMIGRGALMKPWIFQEIKERRHIDLRSSERLDILRKYVNYGLEHWGSDTRGVENTRRFLLEWLSFLHRYIPVGLLVQPPQAFNQRPPFYRGRDHLETLMASTNCKDWITITEMLLGPVPDGFTFLPKHKANAWK